MRCREPHVPVAIPGTAHADKDGKSQRRRPCLHRFVHCGQTVRGHGTPAGTRLALMIAVGIGLHNLGEGLSIGSAYAVGELAIGAGLVVGFAVHNTTEHPPPWPRLLGLGAIAGGPAIAGALLGATVDNSAMAALLLGVGVGAIIQVVTQIWPVLHDTGPVPPRVLGGLAGGMVAMYLTSLLGSVSKC